MTKIDVPTVTKKVDDRNDSIDSSEKEPEWQDSADYDIGDTIPYQITGTMPLNIDKYKSYKYVFTDTMTEGLTYKAENTKITIGEKDVTGSFEEKVVHNDDGSTVVTWSCTDLKKIEGVELNSDSKVVVTYSCELNKDAVIGSAGNPNTVNLQYSNNPNQGGESDTGKTPDDKNIVFTYKVVVNKVDKDHNALAGAKFTLSKVNKDNTTSIIKTFTFTSNDDAGTSFTASGLDEGTYVLSETETPQGYNTIEDQYFTINAEHDKVSDDPKLTELNGVKAGENTTISFTSDKDTGSLNTDVINQKGSSLPTTGGIGTTIFYVIGSILVIGAGVLLVTRKRMNKKS